MLLRYEPSSELGLTLKDAKTRIVELREGGEGLGLSRLPSPLGTRQHALDLGISVSLSAGPRVRRCSELAKRVREITARERLLLPVEDVIEDLNRFLGGSGGLASVTETPPGPSTRSRTRR